MKRNLLGAPAPSIRILNRARSPPRGEYTTRLRVPEDHGTCACLAEYHLHKTPRPSAPGKALRPAGAGPREYTRARTLAAGRGPEYSPGPQPSRAGGGGTGGFAGGLGMRLWGVWPLRSLS